MEKIVGALVLFIVVILLSSCGSATGWRFEIGVSPVKQLDNRAGLSQDKEVTKNDKY